MSLEIYEEVDSGIDKKLFEKVYMAFLKNFGLEDVLETELAIVDEQTIQSVNMSTRKIDQITDVLSFPTIEMKIPFEIGNYKQFVDLQTGEVIFGEIMLCYSRAVQQAEEYGHSITRECAYLFIHGLLHLAGYDHIVQTDKDAMRQKEEEILASLDIVR